MGFGIRVPAGRGASFFAGLYCILVVGYANLPKPGPPTLRPCAKDSYILRRPRFGRGCGWGLCFTYPVPILRAERTLV